MQRKKCFVKDCQTIILGFLNKPVETTTRTTKFYTSMVLNPLAVVIVTVVDGEDFVSSTVPVFIRNH